jgi:hypothetical protein
MKQENGINTIGKNFFSFCNTPESLYHKSPGCSTAPILNKNIKAGVFCHAGEGAILPHSTAMLSEVGGKERHSLLITM